MTSSAGVASTTSLTATPPTPSLYLLPTPSLRSSETLLKRQSTCLEAITGVRSPIRSDIYDDFTVQNVTGSDIQLSLANSAFDSNHEVQPDNSFVIFSPSISSISTLTEPHSVSDLSLDFSNFGLSSLFGLNNTLGGSGVTPPPLSLTPRVTSKTPRCILPVVLNVNIRGGFCQKLDELSVVLQQNSADVECITET